MWVGVSSGWVVRVTGSVSVRWALHQTSNVPATIQIGPGFPADMKLLASSELDSHGRGYPRPQLRRDSWISQSGAWDFAIDREAMWRSPAEVRWDARILMPFAPECAARQAARQAGLAACTPLNLVPADDWDLADGLD
jgi:hypothetical protein